MLKERKLQDFVSELYLPTTGQAPTKTQQTNKPGRPAGRRR
jgi:hypothetical protein